jgi:hypothetical protein
MAAIGATDAAENIFWSWVGSVVSTVLSGGALSGAAGGRAEPVGAAVIAAGVDEPGDTSSD